MARAWKCDNCGQYYDDIGIGSVQYQNFEIEFKFRPIKAEDPRSALPQSDTFFFPAFFGSMRREGEQETTSNFCPDCKRAILLRTLQSLNLQANVSAILTSKQCSTGTLES